MSPLRLLIADDHPAYRVGIRFLLEELDGIEVIGEARNGEEAVAVSLQLCPDVIVMDWNMPVLDGLEATRRIRAAVPQVQVVLLTMREDGDSVYSALCAGALGYVVKRAEPEELVRAIHAVACGEALLSSAAAGALVGCFANPAPRPAPFPELTEREREILELVAQGLGNAEITTRLVLSPKTVRNHVSAILGKLHARDRAEAIVRAREAGLGRAGTRSGHTM
jgi:DNA-binding NarL/FixJ family response regulator